MYKHNLKVLSLVPDHTEALAAHVQMCSCDGNAITQNVAQVF